MVPWRVLPVLLALTAGSGCRSAAAGPGMPDATHEPDEVRTFLVGDELEHLGRVPVKGCCVLFLPGTRDVTIPARWSREESPSGGDEVGGAPSPSPADGDRNQSLRLQEEESKRLGETAVSRGGWPAGLFQDSGMALISHLRSRLAGADGGPLDCRLRMRNRITLEARGPREALAVVERSLEELR